MVVAGLRRVKNLHHLIDIVEIELIPTEQGEHEELARDHAVLSLQQCLLLELSHQDHPRNYPQVSLR